jgi:lysophospholipase L1-like esterase
MNGDQGDDTTRPAEALHLRHFTTERLISFVIGVLLGVLLLYLAAIGAFPFYRTSALQALGVLFVVAVNLAYGALLAAVWRLVVYPKLEDVVISVALLVLAAFATVGVVALDVVVINRFGGDVATSLRVAAALGFVAGLLLALVGAQRFRENREAGKALSEPEKIGLSVVALDAGLTLGLLLTAIPIGISAYVDHVRIAHFDDPIPVITTIKGEYVALGDSYSAGEGLRPFIFNTRGIATDGPESNRCHRSSQAYSMVLDFHNQDPPRRFAACSGAVINDVYHNLVHDADTDNDVSEDVVDVEGEDVSNVKVAAQVNPNATFPEVGLVTITIGGNDMLFSKIVRFCLEEPGCMGAAFSTDATGSRYVDYPDEEPLRRWLADTQDAVQTSVTTTFGKLRTSFPNARILVVGYPYLFPARTPTLVPTECTAVLRRVDHGERKGIRARTDSFNAMLRKEATKADLEYVSVDAVWSGHEPCGELGQYTNSLKPFESEGSFHPSREGQEAIAFAVASYLRDHPDRP